MTRIIQRCFVVLAFTGVLLSAANETTLSQLSDSTTQPNETPTSAPEYSFNSAETSSSYSSTHKVEVNKNALSTEAAAAESSLHSEIAASGRDQTFSKVPTANFSESNAEDFTTVSSITVDTADNAHDGSDEKLSHSDSHSDLFTAELNNDSSVTEAFSTRPDTSDKSIHTSSKKDTEESKQSDGVPEFKTDENKTTAEAAAKQPDYVTFPEHVSIDSGQSTVPSKEELVYNSSYVDRNQSPDDTASTASSEIPSEEIENNDTKSATHKRSLNATNSLIDSSTVRNSDETNSATTSATSLSHDSTPSELVEKEDEKYSLTILPTKQESVSSSTGNQAADENEEFIDIIHDISEDNVASSTHNTNIGISADHIIESGFVVPESSSSTDLQNASLSPISLDALSILNEDSIHPSESYGSKAQIANMSHISTMSFIPQKSPYLEVESEESTSNLTSQASLITFDPDGMTHNFTQEPDSITFSPEVINGKPTDGYLSNLEFEDSHSNKPELFHDRLSTAFVPEEVASSSHNVEGFHPSERERELSFPSRKLSPHDEPDREVQTSMHATEGTKRPEEISANESKTAEKNKTALLTNDESEEMLNDSPHFIQNQNNPTEMSTAELTNQYLNKDLENNISNDITHSSDLKSQDIHKSHHELDFPIEYQTQQSEIRPVTAVSPIKPSETATALPISHDMQSQSPSNVTKSDHPLSTSNDTSITIILHSPAPNVVNQSLEEMTVAISPEILPKDYIPPELLPKDYIPSEMLPKDNVTTQMLPNDFVAPEMLPKDYMPPEMLPKDYVSSEMLPMDYVSSEMPPKNLVKPELLPKDYVPSDLLPKDYIPPELLPKDFVPPEILPRDYTVDQFEQENNTDTNVNSTIAGVAVKTSVSVSLPLSKSPNSTIDAFTNSAKELSNISSKNSDIMPVSIAVNKNNDGPLHSAITTEVPILSTTESKGLRIRKPKLKNNSGDDAPAMPRTRKPFLPSLQKASTTAGPSVSIFKQARTRLASITSSTTHRPLSQVSTIRIHYASRIPGMVPGGEMVVSVEPIPITTTVPTTTETEEPFYEEPFTGQTIGPIVPTEDNVTLLKVAGVIVVDKGLLWNEQLNNRLSPQYKEREKYVQSQLYRLFRTSPIAPQLWKIQIDGFSGRRNSRSVVIDFFLYLIKSQNEITPEQLVTVFHDKLINNTFSRFIVDTNKTTFEFLNEELMRTTTPLPEEIQEPVIPQWAIAVIVVGAASLIFIVLFAAVAILGRHHVRRRYSNKLTDEDSDRPSDWESKMAAAYENLAADTIYDAEDFNSDSYKKRYHNSTYHGRPSRPRRADSWSSSDWSPPPRRSRPQVHRIVY